MGSGSAPSKRAYGWGRRQAAGRGASRALEALVVWLAPGGGGGGDGASNGGAGGEDGKRGQEEVGGLTSILVS